MNYFFYFPLLFWFLTIMRAFFNSLFVNLSYQYALVALVLIIGTRWFVAADFDGYYEIYQEVPLLFKFNLDSTKHIYGEIGYLFFVSVFKTLGAHFSFFIFVLSFLSIGIKYYFFSRFSLGFIAFSVYLLVSFISVELIEVRWSVAISFILVAYYFGLFLNKKLFSILFFLFALMFHYYTILFIFLFFCLHFFKRAMPYYIFFGISLLAAFYIYFNGFNVNLSADSDIYFLQRFFRYLNDPDSKVGLFSILKLVYFVLFYHFVTWLNGNNSVQGGREKALFTFLLISSIALSLSFVPVFYFRAAAIADIFGLVIVFSMISKLRSGLAKIVLPVIFSIPFLFWFFIDVSNSFTSNRIFNFSSSLKLII